MSIFKINNINRVIAGNKEKIVNLNFNGKDINYILDTENDGSDGINNSNVYDNGNNTHGLKPLSSSYIIRDMYDFKDVAIKSAIATRFIYSKSEIKTKNIDIYLPYQYEDPYVFCQVEGYAYGLTKKTFSAPILEKTNLLKNSFKDDLGSIKLSRPAYSYCLNSGNYKNNNGISYYIYNTLSDLNADNKLSASSLYEFISNFNETSVDMISSLYMPKYNMLDISSNYIVEIPVNSQKANNKYKDGIVNGDIIAGKTLYSSTYSENAIDKCKFLNTRLYSDINSCGGAVFLKYYDDVSVSLNNDFKNTTTGLNDVHSKVSMPNVLNHQKVEVINSVNRFLSSSKHKANAYSIKIHNLQLDRIQEYADIKDKIKHDIDNSIRTLLDNLTPAHTQLIDVQFEDD